MSTPNQPNPAQQASDAVIDKILSREFSLGDPISRYIRGDTMATGFAKADVIRAVLEAARELTAAQGVIPAGDESMQPGYCGDAALAKAFRVESTSTSLDTEIAFVHRVTRRAATLSQPIEPQGAVVGEACEPADYEVPDGYRINEFIPGVWEFEWNDTERGWVGYGDYYGGPERACMEAWKDYAADLQQQLLELEPSTEAALPVAVGAGDDWMMRLAKEIKANAEDHSGDYIAKFALAWADELAARSVSNPAMTPATPAGKDSP